jgi:signal transduction histidine kinase
MVKTCFAPAARSGVDELRDEIAAASTNPVINGLLGTVGGLLAVLNEHRQVLAVNDALLELSGAGDPGLVLGLRPGEALRCVHARDNRPGGCGTGRYCRTCGAVLAIVAALAGTRPAEKNCVMTVDRAGASVDLYLKVRAVRIDFDGRRLILIFIQDISAAQRWASLERTFFHDISNLITGLNASTELMEYADEKRLRTLAAQVRSLSSRLVDEVNIQRTLLHHEGFEQAPARREVPAGELLGELRDLFEHHAQALGKRLVLPEGTPQEAVTTDPSLLLRVLANMITNAFEATPEGGEVKVGVEKAANGVAFNVWNRAPIPPDIALRVFQRNFSTKPEPGRGLGTFAMKLLGEDILGGKVSFTTSPDRGTVFSINLPN